MTVTNGTTSHIRVRPLHPTFGAEISGVDFSSPLSDEVFKDIYDAITKVRFRSTLVWYLVGSH
jgi:alpha-ketoglutarate-dependent 2,4-dichlorophenoxyacetate dioxygenase